MSARDELAELIWEDAAADRVKDGSRSALVPVVRAKVEALTDALLAAGYRKPRTITTAEELHTLPDMTVVRSRAGSIVNLMGGRAYIFGIEGSAPSASLALPATVLYEPPAA